MRTVQAANVPTESDPGVASEVRRARPARTIFLTGASGVVGRALVPRLSDADLICLTNCNVVSAPNVTMVSGDVARPRLGLERGLYRSIAEQIDCVVHCAAMTAFNKPADVLERVNVAGTR